MRRRRVALAVLATAALSVLMGGLAGSAAAGGPTSVLLVVPGEGRTASLYTGSSDYEQLVSLIDAYDTPNGSATPPVTANDAGASGTIDASGPGVTLTWLIHDVQVWRVDRVYLDADGGPWISTQTNLNGGDVSAQTPTWHVAGQAKRLAMLLDRLGVGRAIGQPQAPPRATSLRRRSRQFNRPRPGQPLGSSTPAGVPVRTAGSGAWPASCSAPSSR